MLVFLLMMVDKTAKLKEYNRSPLKKESVMGKKINYILSRLIALFVLPSIIFIVVLKPGTPSMFIAMAISAIISFAWICGGFWLTSGFKKQTIDQVMIDVAHCEQHPYWIEYNKFLEDIEKEFPNINMLGVKETALKERKEIEDALEYVKTTWPTEDVVPTFLSTELESWEQRGLYWQRKARDFLGGGSGPEHKRMLDTLRENKRGFQNMVFDVDRAISRIEDIESASFQSLIEPVIALWDKEDNALQEDFDTATSIRETNIALSKMEILKERVETLANLGEMINRKDIIEEPIQEANDEDVLCWFIRSMYNAWQEKPAT